MTAPRPDEELLEIPLKDLRQDGELNVRFINDHTKDIQELAESIKAQGILEPLVVTKENGGKVFRLVFGFRRAAAAKVAGLLTVPAIVRSLTDQEIREAQLVENLQREELLPVEEAKAMKALADSGLTQKEIATRVGKSQPYVANRIRLLGLPEEGVKLLEAGKLTASAAEEILALGEERAQKTVVQYAVDRAKTAEGGVVGERDLEYSLRDAERRVHERQAAAKKIAEAKVPNCPSKDCGKKGRPPSAWAYEQLFRCSEGHRWDPKTGKLSPKDPDRAPRNKPEAPTLPEVKPEVLTDLLPAQVAKRLLDGVKSILSVQLDWYDGTKARLQLEVDLPSIHAAKVPSLDFRRGHKFVELDDLRWQPNDQTRKQAAHVRANLEAWLATFGKPGRKPGKPRSEGM